MQYSNHVNNTWLLAVVFHPFLFCFLSLAMGAGASGVVIIFILSLLVGAAASLPLFLFAHWTLKPVVRFAILPSGLRLVLWCLALGAAFLLYIVLLVGYFTDWSFETELLPYLAPAFGAMLLSVLVRVNAFEQLCQQETPEENSDWEEMIAQPSNTPEI